ncbi:MAG: hypothetical protein ACYTHK_07205 [Planctomycetota bacterium]
MTSPTQLDHARDYADAIILEIVKHVARFHWGFEPVVKPDGEPWMDEIEGSRRNEMAGRYLELFDLCEELVDVRADIIRMQREGGDRD